MFRSFERTEVEEEAVAKTSTQLMSEVCHELRNSAVQIGLSMLEIRSALTVFSMDIVSIILSS